MIDEELRRLYGRAVERHTDESRASCPDPDQLRRLVTRAGAEAGRLAVLDHVMSCAACRPEFELLRAQHVAAPRWSPQGRLLAAASVMLAAGLGVVWVAHDPAPRVVARSAASGVELLRPPDGAEVDSAVTLAWRPVPHATAYVVELLDPGGSLVFSTSTPDTVLPVWQGGGIEPGVEYRWWVQVVQPSGARVGAPARRLRFRSRP